MRIKARVTRHKSQGLGLFFCLVPFAFCLGMTAAYAQSFPERPVRIIVPFPPGGGTDGFARILGARLTEIWGQQVIVDNRGGAQGQHRHRTWARSGAATPNPYACPPGALW